MYEGYNKTDKKYLTKEEKEELQYYQKQSRDINEQRNEG